jgi:hypothetical protein
MQSSEFTPAPLRILHLEGEQPRVYAVARHGLEEETGPQRGWTQPEALADHARRDLSCRWLVLADYAEEEFWGDVMPPLRGAARKAWLGRMQHRFAMESPFRWISLQGRSRSSPGKLRVLGYSLGNAERVMPWLEALEGAQAKLGGVYTPIMLAAPLLRRLKLPQRGPVVLVTAHPSGLRQCVVIDGRPCFSRLALRADAGGAGWLPAVREETARLKDYLVENGILVRDKAPLHVVSLCPAGMDPQAAAGPDGAQNIHHLLRADTVARAFRLPPAWAHSPGLSRLLFVFALARGAPPDQLAPPALLRNDWVARTARNTRLAGYSLCGACLLYAAGLAVSLWPLSAQLSEAAASTRKFDTRYQREAATFPASALKADELLALEQKAKALEPSPPGPRALLAAAGGVLAKHTELQLDQLRWEQDAFGPASPPALRMRGAVQGLQPDDLRGARDAMARFTASLVSAGLAAEVIKVPLDLQSSASINGSGQQDKAELGFEVKVWSR